MSPLNLYARVHISLCILHTRPRVQRAPAIPCALLFSRVNPIKTRAHRAARMRSHALDEAKRVYRERAAGPWLGCSFRTHALRSKRPAGRLLFPHRAPGVRGELPTPGDDHDQGGRCEEDPGTDEPAEIAECKEERALAAVEMPAGGFEQSRGPDHMRFGLRRVAGFDRRHRAEQDGDVIEQPVGPGEFEEGVDEIRVSPTHLISHSA